MNSEQGKSIYLNFKLSANEEIQSKCNWCLTREGNDDSSLRIIVANTFELRVEEGGSTKWIALPHVEEGEIVIPAAVIDGMNEVKDFVDKILKTS